MDTNNRRNFLKKSIVGMAGLSVLPSVKGVNNHDITNKHNPDKFITRKLGRTGIEVPIVSMGVMNASIPGVVKQSIEKGVRLFDTAWFYQNGLNEKMVGEVVAESGKRDELTIMTKIYLKETKRDLYAPGIKELFLERFDQSLSRLKMDYVDILFYHATSTVEEQNNPQIIEAFKELKAAGKIKYTAVSFHGDEVVLLDDVVEKGFYDVVMIMFNAAKADDAGLIKSMKNAAEKGVGIVAMKTQCGGGGRHWKRRFEGSDIADMELNQTALLKWVLRHEFVHTAIPGYTAYDQLDQNISVAYNLTYTEEEKEFLSKASLPLAASFCIRCGKCIDSCPYKNDVPKLMSTYMYAYQYNNVAHALAMEKTIEKDKGLLNCADCDVCVAQCTRKVNIAERISGLKELNFA